MRNQKLAFTIVFAVFALGIALYSLGVFEQVDQLNLATRSNLHLRKDSLRPSFNNWKQKYSKVYSVAENNKRFQIWLRNYEVIKAHNSIPRNYTVGLNQFSDLTREELEAVYLTLSYSESALASRKPVYLNNTNAPSSLDWRTKNAVSQISNQGNCGSGWAFSAVGALEGIWSKKTGKLVPLSAQQLLDCSKGFGNNGCNGGYMDYAFDYVQMYGIHSAEKYPYTGRNHNCTYESKSIIFKSQDKTAVSRNDHNQLLQAVAMQPISVGFESNSTAFLYYESGIIDTTECGPRLNHGGLIVGYGTENGIDYWILKNSWGAKWGEKGYARIARGSQNAGAGICGVNKLASYPSVK